ncbi:tripartite tricarboxylate transporter permease [Candidatus Woesearchaeota archaeon]|nr:tripartite tricarboxylate transporter permease [Candidatus Woesearchaeota archaeon]
MQLFVEIIIATAAGILTGTLTGICPGIHINLVVAFLISQIAILNKYADPISLCAFIIAVSITHIFLDFIPATFLGAPEESTALSVLPGHRYLMAGNGIMAIKLAMIGCFSGILLAALTLYPIIEFLPMIIPYIQKYMIFFLIIIILAMIQQNTKRIWAAIVFLLAGITGIIVFAMPNLREPLFPLLSGLFGTSTLLLSLKESNSIPQQFQTELIGIEKKPFMKSLIASQFAALIVALFPGISAGIASIFGMQLTRNNGDQGYMLLQGAVNGAGFVVSLGTLYAIQKARNGAVVGIQQILIEPTGAQIMICALISVIVACTAIPITLFIAKRFGKYITKINYKKTIIGIICFLILLTFILSGWIGIIILATTTAIGIIPGIKKVTRTMAMGCLLLPVVVHYWNG